MDDEALAEGFERLVRLSAGRAPSMAELEGRVVRRRHRRRRTRQGLWLGAFVLIAGLVGVTAVTMGEQPDARTRLTSDPPVTTVPAPSSSSPVFTIAFLPDDLAFRACNPMSSETDLDDVTGVECTSDNPATAEADGLRISRLIGGATAELRAAWEAGDAPAAARASGGSDDPDTARFVTMGGTKVLDLAPGGVASGDAAATLRLIVGQDLVDVGSTNVTTADLRRVVSGMSMEAPSPEVTAALDALPDGTVALVQGERPLWVQPDALDPASRTRFGGVTVGAELLVPGSTQLIGVDVTIGIDAVAFLDGLLADGLPALTETEISSRRAVVLGPDGMMPVTVPEPRAGPQVIVQSDPQTLVRIKDPGGSEAQIRAIATALN